MDPTTRWRSHNWRLAALLAVGVPVILWAVPYSFFILDPAYAQRLFGVTSSFLRTAPARGYLGGVVALQNGDVIAAECETSVTRLHRFSASSTYVVRGTTLHAETISNPIAGGCGIALHPDGYLYSNMFEGASGFGVSRIDLATGAVTKMGPPGNALGIAIDPVSHNIVYAGQGCKPAFGPPPCTLFELDPATGLVVNLIPLDPLQFQYIDGVAFNPTGEYLFLTNRDPTFDLIVLRRTSGTAVVVQKVPTSAEPIGIGFHAVSPKFVVTNNQNGTMTRLVFPGDDYMAPPTESQLAQQGFRGDLMQAGPDGCLYVTQDGSRYDDGDNGPPTENSIVQICDGFAAPPGITPNPPPPPSSLCGFVYNDVDNDGMRDAGEPAIPGVSVTLSGHDHLGRVVGSPTATAPDGAYCFNNLRAGTYTIRETQPGGYLDGKDTQRTPGTGTTGNDVFSNIVLAAGVQGGDNNFGELLPSSLCGSVYADRDNNGIRTGGEAGIGGVAVTFTGTDDLGATVSMPIATGSDGAYCFMGLRPGTYTITEKQPAGHIDGKDTQGTPGTGTTDDDAFRNIGLNQNVSGRDNNFGEIVPAPAVALVKKTNGTNNDTGTGPEIVSGSTVTWTYLVTNTGNVPLSHVAVVDDKAGAVACPAATLEPAATLTCTKSGTAILGQYTNIGSVTARDGTGNTVSAQNVDRYLGVAPPVADLGIAASAPPTLVAGTTLNYAFNAVNNGTSSGNDVAVAHTVPANLKFVSLNKPAGWSCITPAPGSAGTITCTKSSMAVGERGSFSIALGSSCPLPNARSVTLAATISSSTADPNPLNNASSATIAILNPAPVIRNARVSPSTMWPPNHKMWNVRVDYTVVGGCGGTATTRLEVASNEPPNGTDWEIVDARNLRLRSERNGGGRGRVYTIFIIATDPTTGMSTTSTVPVTVVHDQGNGKRR